MLTKDLIAMLQKMIDEHKASGAEEIMGEHEVVTWHYSPLETKGHYRCDGYTPFIGSEFCAGYDVICDREPTNEEKKQYGIK